MDDPPSAPGRTPRSWSDPAQVDRWLARVDAVPARTEGEAVLVDLLPPDPRRIADLGCGDGRLAARVLDARPGVGTVVAYDVSPPMVARARRRFAGRPGVTVVLHDLADPLPDDGPFDVVVTGLAVHHLSDDRKRTLLDEVVARLAPGGLYANLEVVTSPSPELHAEFLAAIGREADDPEDRLVDTDVQLGWMVDAGLVGVRCPWRWRGYALLVGAAPGAGPASHPGGRGHG